MYYIHYITVTKIKLRQFFYEVVFDKGKYQIILNQRKLKTNTLIKIFPSVYKQSSSFSKIAKLKDLQSRNRCYTFLANQTKQIPNCDKYTSVEYVYK